MEASHLTKAHDHARAAAEATRHGDAALAVTEHAWAADEFAHALKATDNVEASRMLRLLEQHHRRLAELLRFSLENNTSRSGGSVDTAETKRTDASRDDGASPEKPSRSPASANTTRPASKPTPSLSQQRRPLSRDLSSSIASNLASARGIRSRYRGQPLSPSVSNDQAPGSLEVHPREGSPKSSAPGGPDRAARPSWVPPTPPSAPPTTAGGQPAAGAARPEESRSAPSDDGFSRFYNTFGSLINRLSAPLAFAGLPLVVEEPPSNPPPPPDAVRDPPPPKRQPKSSPSSSADPDISRLYSKAALRAMRGDTHGANDSFYVVPTSGHTLSYANILSFEQKEKRRTAASHTGDRAEATDEADLDDFVDAAESQAAMSPELKKRMGSARSEKHLQNVVEELYLENKSLKEMLDKLSRRLHAFELNSQSSHLALAQSLRLQRPGSPTSSSGGAGAGAGSEELLRKRNQELEAQLAEAIRRLESLEKDHRKLQETVEKYRDRWEKLKAGAKARREAQGSADHGEAAKPSR